jgi:hypothetical protein
VPELAPAGASPAGHAGRPRRRRAASCRRGRRAERAPPRARRTCPRRTRARRRATTRPTPRPGSAARTPPATAPRSTRPAARARAPSSGSRPAPAPASAGSGGSSRSRARPRRRSVERRSRGSGRAHPRRPQARLEGSAARSWRENAAFSPAALNQAHRSATLYRSVYRAGPCSGLRPPPSGAARLDREPSRARAPFYRVRTVRTRRRAPFSS